MERQRCAVVLSRSVAVVLTGRPFRSRRVGTLLQYAGQIQDLEEGEWSDKGLISRRQPRCQGNQVVEEKGAGGGFCSWYRGSEVSWRQAQFPYLGVVIRVEAGFRLVWAQRRDWAKQEKTKNRMWSPGVGCRPLTDHKSPLHDAWMHDLCVIYRAKPGSLTARETNDLSRSTFLVKK